MQTWSAITWWEILLLALFVIVVAISVVCVARACAVANPDSPGGRLMKRAIDWALKTRKEKRKKKPDESPLPAVTVEHPPTAAAPTTLSPVVETPVGTKSTSRSNSSGDLGFCRASAVPKAVSTPIFEPPRASPSLQQPAALPSPLLPASTQPIEKPAPAAENKPATAPSKESTLVTARQKASVKLIDKATGKVAPGVSAAELHIDDTFL
ncbi:hypothetical protein PRIPAC_90341 [Pristionchus pacificus]|uniref:Uncharacterized protein n=1 Tax=Pristionchus pacificus TaxID=54126 RepID=A0A2A6B5P2_PRIPA|nr:hypothetical protein PRIPAC_90341 [Pristionchus pacificus]|eukprot:PDM61192.1 hypothetical protein PRIPAC_50634 [Pristionchus pacificus]